MLKINLNHSERKPLDNLIKRLNHPNAILRPLVVIKIGQAFCMYHQTSPHNYKIRNQMSQKNHLILINDLDNNFTYFMVDNNYGKIIHLYLVDHPWHLLTIDSSLKNIHKQPFKSNLDYFYYFTKQLEQNLHLRK